MALGHLEGGPYLANGRPNTIKANSKDPNLLSDPLRIPVLAMIADCPYHGELGTSSAVRDPGTQWDLRRGRVGINRIWDSRYKGSPTTAVPARWNYSTKRWEGGSRHQTGDAMDFGGTYRAMDWMRANRGRYGLNLTVRNEGWHVEANRRDVLTGRIAYVPAHLLPGASQPPTPTPPPTPEIPKDWLDMATEEDVRDLLREELATVSKKDQPYTVKATGQGKGRVANGSVWIVYPATGEAWRPTAKSDVENWRATLDTLAFFGAIRPDEVPLEAAQIARLYRLVG